MKQDRHGASNGAIKKTNDRSAERVTGQREAIDSAYTYAIEGLTVSEYNTLSACWETWLQESTLDSCNEFNLDIATQRADIHGGTSHYAAPTDR